MQDIRGSKYVLGISYTHTKLSLKSSNTNFFFYGYRNIFEIFCSFSIRRIMVLEFSQYLENFLWPNYKPGASVAHIMSIVIMVNEKFRERVQVWQVRKCLKLWNI